MSAFTSPHSARRGVVRWVSAVSLVWACLPACKVDENFLGLDRSVSVPSSTASAVASGSATAPSVELDAGVQVPTSLPPPVTEDSGTSDGSSAETEPTETETLPPTPEDASAPEPAPEPLVPNPDLPNLFVDVLGLDELEVAEKVDGTFDQLFHGNPDDQAIYYELPGTQEAYVYDVLHEDTRLDALGYGLLITVLLDKQDEFERIWRYTKNNFQYPDGVKQGYFRGTCKLDGECSDDVAFLPHASFMVVTSLFFAEGRWGNGEAELDFGAEARSVLQAFVSKEDPEDAGVELDAGSERVINFFDQRTHLPNALPVESGRGQATPGSVVPAYFEIWGARTADPFWTLAAVKGRDFVAEAMHPNTGLAPMRATHAGVPVADSEIFNESSYAVGFNLALDYAWFEHDAREVELADRLLGFFGAFPSRAYPSVFSTHGTALNEIPSGALLSINGATAAISTVDARERMIRAVWETPTPVSLYRFYDGVNHLLSLLYLSGQFRAY